MAFPSSSTSFEFSTPSEARPAFSLPARSTIFSSPLLLMFVPSSNVLVDSKVIENTTCDLVHKTYMTLERPERNSIYKQTVLTLVKSKDCATHIVNICMALGYLDDVSLKFVRAKCRRCSALKSMPQPQSGGGCKLHSKCLDGVLGGPGGKT